MRCRSSSKIIGALVLVTPLVCCGIRAAADGPEQSLLSITSIKNAKNGETNRFGLGDRITAEISGAAFPFQLVTADPKKVVLLLNDVALRGLCTNVTLVANPTMVTNEDAARTIVTNAGAARLDFVLLRTDANRADWATLLGSPKSRTRSVTLQIGAESNGLVTILSQQVPSLTLVLLPDEPFFKRGTGRGWTIAIWAFIASALFLAGSLFYYRTLEALLEGWIWIGWAVLLASTFLCWGPAQCWLGFAILFGVGFWYLAQNTEMLRDSGPPPPPSKLRPYSLARTQMAIWFFLSISSFVFIWLMTGALDTITGTILALMGIGAGTALGAETQTVGKLNSYQSEKATLEQKPKAQRTPDEECRLKLLRRLTMDVPCLEGERATLEAEMTAIREKITELNGSLSKEAALTAEKTQLESKPNRDAAEMSRLDEVRRLLAAMPQMRTSLTAAQAALAADEPQGRLQEIDDLLASRPVSQGFFDDILTDDLGGISFHRFQMFVWTLVLGLIFISSVYRQLAMPEFNDTLLALMGISSGTYMGFMIAEKPTPAARQA
jgi:hypothetical protein